MHQSDCRRAGVRLLLPLLLTFAFAWSLPAQQPADTIPAAPAAPDSLDDLPQDSSVESMTDSLAGRADEDFPEDTTDVVRLRPSHRAPRGSNPHLREVRVDQRTRQRGRYYLTASLGAGNEAIAAPGPHTPFSPPRTRPTLTAGVGVNVSQQLRLGVDGFGWFNSQSDGQLETVTALLFGGRVYPFQGAGFYLRAAGGLGVYDIGDYDWNCGCTVNGHSEVGLAWSLGGGVDIPVSRSLSLGPTLEVVRFNVTGPGGYRERVVNLGFSVMVDSH